MLKGNENFHALDEIRTGDPNGHFATHVQSTDGSDMTRTMSASVPCKSLMMNRAAELGDAMRQLAP